MSEDRAQEREWIRQNNLANAGLIGAALIVVQPFLTARRLDIAARICVVSFAVAIPLLAALVSVGQQETFRQHPTKSVLVNWIAKPVALGSAFVGFVAAFWHITWIAGVAMLVFAFVALGVHSAGFWRLELEMPNSPARLEQLRTEESVRTQLDRRLSRQPEGGDDAGELREPGNPPAPKRRPGDLSEPPK